MKKALITGISGQDGYFLSKLLKEKGYNVHGLVRRNSQMSIGTLDHLAPQIKDSIHIHWGDVTDHVVVEQVIRKEQFDEVYHLAAQSFVGLSFTNPKLTYDVNISGTLNIVNAVKEFSSHTRLYFAATSELYGVTKISPQNEETPFYPRSPYGVSKLAGFWTIKNYREAYGLFMSNGILFNHESEMRGEEFVTRKITLAATRIAKGSSETLLLGNLEAKRDWGYAGDYVEGMWRILQQPKPDDFVLATGESHSIREFVEETFKQVGIPLRWEGHGILEEGFHGVTGKLMIKVDPQFFRPAEVEALIGDSSKAKQALGWSPTIDFPHLVEIMVKADMENA